MRTVRPRDADDLTPAELATAAIDLDRVLEREPQLGDFGFGVSDSRTKTPEERIADLRHNRDLIREPNSLAQFMAARGWLSQFGKIRALNKHGTSYGLKHCAAGDIGYVTNGCFIASAERLVDRASQCPSFPGLSGRNLRNLPPYWRSVCHDAQNHIAVALARAAHGAEAVEHEPVKPDQTLASLIDLVLIAYATERQSSGNRVERLDPNCARGLMMRSITRWSRCARARAPLLLLRITGAAELDVVAFSFAALFASFDTLSIALIRCRHVPEGPRSGWRTHGSFSYGPPALAHPALGPLLAGVAPDMHDASGGSVGDDDAERAGGIVQAEDALVDPRVDETIIVVPGHFLLVRAAAAGSMPWRPVDWRD